MPPFFHSSAWRRRLIWLLAFLVPLHALAAGARAATGPAHTHLPAASTRLVLDDLRRAPVRRIGVESHAGGAFGHFHGSGGAERHHHAVGDPSVAVEGGDRLHAGDADDLGVSLSLAVFVGLISAPPDWLDVSTPDLPAAHSRWTPLTHHPALLERPPRAG